MSKISNKKLADAYGAAKARLTLLEKELDALANEIKNRGFAEAVGEDFMVSVVKNITRKYLDQSAVKTVLGEDWVAQHQLESTFTKINVVAIKN